MPPSSSPKSKHTLRIVAMTALYMAAIAVAVAFSPVNGFGHPESLAQIIGLAPQPPLSRPE